MQSARYFCQILMNLEFSRRVFEKYSDIKFGENPSKWEPSCSLRMDGQTDRYDGSNSRFL